MERSWLGSRVEAIVDLAALARNIRSLRDHAGRAMVMAVVKADAYGHGLVPCAQTAVSSGAEWLGTALPAEALALRAAGLKCPILAWLWTPDGPFIDAVKMNVDISISGFWDLKAAVAAAIAIGHPARVHLKIDTGLGRNGCSADDWPGVVKAVAGKVADGNLEIIGVWSHLAMADSPGHPSVGQQLRAFDLAVNVARSYGVEPVFRHIANSAATVSLPNCRLDLVRCGLATYGLSPIPSHFKPRDLGLTPVMSVSTVLANVKRLANRQAIGYGLSYEVGPNTMLGLVPVGYADGIPRHASNTATVSVNGVRRPVAGLVSMDQFTIDLGQDDCSVGQTVIIFGSGERGEPTAEDWAQAADTISYEIVSRLGSRIPRVYVNG